MTGTAPARRPTRKPRARWPVGRRTRKAMVVVHIVVSLGWMGAGAANVVLALTALLGDQTLHHACYRFIQQIDTFLVIPAAFTALITGIALGLATPWGVLRYWWVLLKLIITTVVIVASTFGIGVWVELSIEATRGGGTSPYALPIVVGALANIAAFLIMTWLSVVKPGGEVRPTTSVGADRPERYRRSKA